MIGRLEEAVLTVLLYTDGEPTATQVHEILSGIISTASTGAMYVTLERLERKGLVSRQLGEPTSERGGKAQYYHKLTLLGERALQEIAELNAALASLAPQKPDRPPAGTLKTTRRRQP